MSGNSPRTNGFGAEYPFVEPPVQGSTDRRSGEFTPPPSWAYAMPIQMGRSETSSRVGKAVCNSHTPNSFFS